MSSTAPTHADPTSPPEAPGWWRAPRPAEVMLVAVGLMVAFVATELVFNGGDITEFVTAGEGYTDPAEADQLVEYGIDIGERPAYRQQRILYPALVWLASAGGRAGAVPWAMVLVNLAGVGLVAYFGSLAARDLARSTWWGLAFAAWPGLLVATARDLSEVVAAALLMASILALRRGRWRLAAAAMLGAALGRETTLVLPLALLGSSVLGALGVRGLVGSFGRSASHRRPVPWWVGPVSLAGYGLWQVVVRANWPAGQAGTVEEANSFFSPPLWGLVGQFQSWFIAPDGDGVYQMIQLVIVLAVLVSLATALANRGAGCPHERLALVGALIVVSVLPDWDRSVVFMRWTDEAFLFGLLVALSGGRVHRLVPRALAFLWVTSALYWLLI